jgi:hypothetical protein
MGVAKPSCASIFRVMQELVKRRLPYASDEALLSFVDLEMGEMAALRSMNPDLCYDYPFSCAGRSAIRCDEIHRR